MKKTLFRASLLCAVAAVAALFSACSDKKESNDPDNIVRVGGESYAIDHGAVIYHGDFYNTGDTENLSLRLYNRDNTTAIYLNIIVADGVSKLLPGTYNVIHYTPPTDDTPGTKLTPFTILDFESTIVDGDRSAAITGGSVDVSKSGDTFNITFNLTTGAGDLTGKCVLPLDSVDESQGLGTLILAGQSAGITTARQVWYDQREEEVAAGSRVIDLILSNSSQSLGLRVSMFVPVENTELQSGTYTFSPDFEPFTYIPGFAYIGMVAPLVGGTVTVDRTDNNIYTIEFALQCLVGGTEVGDITGTIHGSLLKEKGTDTGGGE